MRRFDRGREQSHGARLHQRQRQLQEAERRDDVDREGALEARRRDLRHGVDCLSLVSGVVDEEVFEEREREIIFLEGEREREKGRGIFLKEVEDNFFSLSFFAPPARS